MADFREFSANVHAQLMRMNQFELFSVGHDNREFERVYLQTFPEGTNPVYKTNTEHDCSCCKNFIRNFGRVISIRNGKVMTVWDVSENVPYPYNVVAETMAEFVRSQPIVGVFRTKETQYGAEQTKQLLENGQVHCWSHFWGKVAQKYRTNTPDKAIGEYNAAIQVFRRGLTELKISALTEVQQLISDHALYRGEEHAQAVNEFALAHLKASKMSEAERELYIWENALKPWSRFRNTVIGTLVIDISDGMDIEQAVKSFEQKVAPTNYKRPTALITPKMVEQAMATIKDLKLEHSLKRRFARLSDISVQNVLWVSSTAKTKMKSTIENLLMTEAKKTVKPTTPTNLSMDRFMAEIVPKAKTMEIMVKTEHSSNFVSLTGPVHQDEPRLFKWPNDFGWSYDGNITDSIKEKVKRAGGNVQAKLRFSLAWSNFDDLDIHVHTPGGEHVYFGNKAGKLDVDMNAGGGITRTPVENVSFVQVQDGIYEIKINQYHRRETIDIGFMVEIDSQGKLWHLNYPRAVEGTVNVAKVHVKNGQVINIAPGKNIEHSELSIEKWGVKTETWTPVQTLMFSPNHWDGHAVGNRHWMFMLEGCTNPEPTRGIYNEFLRPELEVHRKVFEVLGNRSKCEPATEQLSGVGFSSTKGESVTIRVDDGRVYEVTF